MQTGLDSDPDALSILPHTWSEPQEEVDRGRANGTDARGSFDQA